MIWECRVPCEQSNWQNVTNLCSVSKYCITSKQNTKHPAIKIQKASKKFQLAIASIANISRPKKLLIPFRKSWSIMNNIEVRSGWNSSMEFRFKLISTKPSSKIATDIMCGMLMHACFLNCLSVHTCDDPCEQIN